MKDLVKYIEENALTLETDEAARAEFLAKYDKSDIYDALFAVDWTDVLLHYPDKVLGEMAEKGTSFPKDKKLSILLYNSVLREISFRSHMSPD